MEMEDIFVRLSCNEALQRRRVPLGSIGFQRIPWVPSGFLRGSFGVPSGLLRGSFRVPSEFLWRSFGAPFVSFLIFSKCILQLKEFLLAGWD